MSPYRRFVPSRRRGGLGLQLEGPTAAGLMYSDSGGDGPVVVLLHGVVMSGTLWDTVVGGLEDRHRCIVPELPCGAHTAPMPDDADLSLAALATTIAGFLTELDLRHVTVVCNDWGGAQLVISPGGTDRVANLVLVSCEAFDNYPPGVPGRLLCPSRTLRLPRHQRHHTVIVFRILQPNQAQYVRENMLSLAEHIWVVLRFVNAIAMRIRIHKAGNSYLRGAV